MVKHANISDVVEDGRHPNYSKIKRYIMLGVKELTGKRITNFTFRTSKQNVTTSQQNISTVQVSAPQSDIPILPQYSYSDINPVVGSPVPIIIVIGPCGFDVIFTILATIYKDVEEVRNRVNQSNKSYDKLIKIAFTKPMADAIAQRGKIFSEMFPSELVPKGPNVQEIISGKHIPVLIEKINKLSDIVYSAKEYAHCKRCNNTRIKKIHNFLPLKMYYLNPNGHLDVIKNMQKHVDDMNWQFYEICQICGQQMEMDIEYNSVVFIDMAVQFHYKGPRHSDYQYPVNKDEITKQIRLKGRQNRLYHLRGAIELRLINMNHVVANVIRNDKRWEMYDDLEDTVQVPLEEFTSIAYVYGGLDFFFFAKWSLIYDIFYFSCVVTIQSV